MKHGRSEPLTPEQVAQAKRQLSGIQREVKAACVHKPAPDDKPTIPAPPPSPERLRPAKRPHRGWPQHPGDDKPTTPPPFPQINPDDPRYPT